MKNKIALVTGGSRGIGAAVASALLQEGCQVMIMSRTESELKKTAAQLSSLPNGKIFWFCGDVANEKTVAQMFEKIKKDMGTLDILVNNAAIVGMDSFEDLKTSTWDEVMAVNLRGSFLCSKFAFEHMQGKGGSIVNISSLAGVRGTEKFPKLTPYIVSKFGVVGLTEALAVEGRRHNIRVNCIAPGAVDTEMLRSAAPFLKTETKPADIAESVLFFCDESRSKKISGSILEVFSNVA